MVGATDYCGGEFPTRRPDRISAPSARRPRPRLAELFIHTYDHTVTNTREQLVQATRDAIRDVGMQRATAREITGRASANLASIPYHFGSKDALVAEALVAEARELLASDRPGSERAVEAASLLEKMFEHSRRQIPVYLAALAAAQHDGAVRDGLAGLWTELTDRVAEDVARQCDAGLLPSWVQPRAMAMLIVSVVNGVVVGSALDPEGLDHRAVAAQFLSLLLTARPQP
jgi:AcrR family transcriptional regulator